MNDRNAVDSSAAAERETSRRAAEPGSSAERVLAAVDLGSNSFHLLVSRWTGTHLRTVDKRKETVRLAAGLDEHRSLSNEAQQRALAALSRLGESIRGLPAEHVRAVGTNTLRAARNSRDFLGRASAALGHDIEVISGSEEARLVYLGVAHSIQPEHGRRLVVDIGGGSTECVIGEGFEPLSCHSLRMGCVTYSRRFFADGELRADAFEAARSAACSEVTSLEHEFKSLDWKKAIGSSGTVRAIAAAVTSEGWIDQGISAKSLRKLRERLVAIGHVDRVDLDDLSDNRREVLPGGVAILSAVFDRLGVEHMEYSEGALRDGVLYDLIGRTRGEDVRERTVSAMVVRYDADVQHACRVAERLEALIENVKHDWKLTDAKWLRFGSWAARLHGVGLAINYAGHHKHGAYLIEHSAMAGFSREDQRFLAGLVLCHRRKFRYEALSDIPTISSEPAVRLAILLRLAVKLEHTRHATSSPPVDLRVDGNRLRLRLPAGSQSSYPLL